MTEANKTLIHFFSQLSLEEQNKVLAYMKEPNNDFKQRNEGRELFILIVMKTGMMIELVNDICKTLGITEVSQ